MLQTAILAAREAGSILLDNFRKPRQTKVKGLRDIVTDADVKAQRAIIEIIQARFPDHDILAEESDPGSQAQTDVKGGFDKLTKGRPYTWIVDPLDGTTNYSRRVPCFCTSIALSYQGKVILGVVYDPLRDCLFQAERGKGAYLNGERLRVSSVESPADALVGFDWARAQDERELIAQWVARMALQARTLRTLGAAALGLCYVAASWLDVYLHFSLKPWDAAAGALMVQEAGGSASDFTGHTWQTHSRRCLASNGLLHDEMRSILGCR
ncbi:MAG: inositol monophosphatase [Anaerolineales bacterium]|nr:MAG: inositol monophosphatase [Anaerolineales bacterium]